VSVGALFLTPGAGSDRDHPSLLAIEAAVAPLPVERHDFPYRRAGTKAPDRAPKAIADLQEAVPAFAARVGVDPSSVVLGGRSFGGRMCSMAVAEGLPAAGLVLISYPLHPPGKPERLRIEHLPSLTVPCLFVSGTRDPFGTPEELEAHTAVIPGPVTHVRVEGAGHDLKRADALLAEAVTSWLDGLRAAASPATRRPRRPPG
jgi:predicted alpha/beta-hydrolase family hydrolase